MGGGHMKNLTEIRLEKGVTLKQLGQKLNLAESTISLYESGKRQPGFETLIQIADYFNVSIDYLFGRELKISNSPVLTPDESALVDMFRGMDDDRREMMLNIAKMQTGQKVKK
jgi:transcriptional regulator with XRE-family HTH domain